MKNGIYVEPSTTISLHHFDCPMFQAKVMKIGPDAVDDHYFPTYMSIGSWYSPSKCHTLIEGKPVSHEVRKSTNIPFYEKEEMYA